MSAKLDVTGERYGYLVGIEIASESGDNVTKWRFRCDCGTEIITRLGNVRNGHTKSCGCLQDETRRAGISHGHERNHRPSRTLKSYRHAKSRCFNTSDPKYASYGGRGITMCDRWRDSFAAFLEDMGEAPLGTTIDRINNDGNYEPGNCRWATPTQQSRNRSNIIYVEHGGKKMSLKEFTQSVGANYGTVYSKIARGADPQEVATTIAGAFGKRRQ